MRIFPHIKALTLLGKAIRSKIDALAISMTALVIITVILSSLLYLVEHNSQSEYFDNVWNAFVWIFVKYFNDPGEIADFPVQTFWGQIIATTVGFLNIAIFAVSTGIIGSGFLEEIENDKHKSVVLRNIDKLHNVFERKLDRYTGYQIMPPFLSIADIQARMRMSESDIFEALDNKFDGSDTTHHFRAINLAATIPVNKNPQDRLAVEHFLVNRPYGYIIDRGSKVTIVSVSNIVDPVIGHFAYYMAKIGGFNYISREIGETRPYESFYIYSETDLQPQTKLKSGLTEFMSDLQTLSAKEGSWIITMLAASGANEPEYHTQVHFCYGGAKGNESLSTKDILIHDIPLADKLMNSIASALKKQYDITCDRQKYHSTDNPKIYIRHLNNYDSVNALFIRIAWSIICHDPRRTAITKTIADEIHRLIEPDKENLSLTELKVKGIGLSDYRH